MLKLRGFVFFLLLLFSAIKLNAQQYSFINYSSEDGLPQSQVRAITQDSLGFLWVATLGGVSRFDGYTFENYSVLDGLLGNQVSSLAVDRKGMVWMGSKGGVSVFDGDTIVSYKFNEANKSAIASNIYADHDTLWISTNKGKLIKFSRDKYTYFTDFEGLDTLIVQSVIRIAKGDLLLSTRNGVFRFGTNISRPFLFPELHKYIRKIIEVDDVLWFGSRWKGLFKMDNDSISNYSRDDLVINDFIIRNKSEVWAASRMGISKWDGRKFLIFNENNGLEFDDVRCLFVDRENILWIGTNGGGLYKFSGELITTTTTKGGLNSNLVMSIIEDDKNNLIVGTFDKGLNVLLEDTILFIEKKQGLLTDRIWSLTKQKDKAIWVASSGGLSEVTDKDILNYVKSDGLLNDKITSLYMDNDQGVLWIGSNDGYTLFKDNQFLNFDKKNGFPGKRVRNIKKDKSGHVWFGCINGLVEYNGSSYKTYTILDGLPDNTVYCLEFEGDKIWVGTKAGLGILKDGKISPFKLGKTTGDMQILFLLNDKRGRVWVGTNNGIYTIQSNSDETYKIEHYTKENGLNGMACNMNAVYVDTKGNVYAGLETGLIRFSRKELDQIKPDQPPKTIIKNLKLYLNHMDWKTYSDSLIPLTSLPYNLHLKPEDNYLTFDFTGFIFDSPSKVQYRFKLLGAEGKLSDEWSTPTYNNFATFSNLSSGDYTFKVQATTEANNWPDDSTDYSFTIITPYYATWWFRGLIVLLIGAIAYLVVDWRLSIVRQKRENKRLMDQSKMLALEQQTLNANMNRHFVFNSLNSIQYYLNNEDKYNANLYLSRFAKLIRKNLDSSQAAFTSLNEEIERMKLYLGLEQMRFKDRFDYEFIIGNGIDLLRTKIPSMLFQPYLENSIWHGILPMNKKGNIEISISLNEDDTIEIEIIDDGIGIQTSLGEKAKKKSDHISKGMDITRDRINLFKQIGKNNASITGPEEMRIDGKTIGTRVKLVLPLLKY